MREDGDGVCGSGRERSSSFVLVSREEEGRGRVLEDGGGSSP